MARIKIEDLPEDKSISSQEMRNVFGGGIFADMQMGGILADIQTENSEFNLVSNIMKTRHEAAKNSI